MKVKIRGDWEIDGQARSLGDIPLSRPTLEDVIPLLGAWGIRDSTDGENYDRSHLSGEVVLGPDEAYFLVTINAMDA